MEPWLQTAITIVCAVIASSGFWAFISKRSDRKSEFTKMLIGLGHDRIMSLGKTYIKRGCVTPDELENLYEYLYKPYETLGGNGSARVIMEKVRGLPMCTPTVCAPPRIAEHSETT